MEMFCHLHRSDFVVALACDRTRTSRSCCVSSKHSAGVPCTRVGRVHGRKDQHGCSDDRSSFCWTIDRWFCSFPCGFSAHAASKAHRANVITTRGGEDGSPDFAGNSSPHGWLRRDVNKRLCADCNFWSTRRINTGHRNRRELDFAARICRLGISSRIGLNATGPGTRNAPVDLRVTELSACRHATSNTRPQLSEMLAQPTC